MGHAIIETPGRASGRWLRYPGVGGDRLGATRLKRDVEGVNAVVLARSAGREGSGRRRARPRGALCFSG